MNEINTLFGFTIGPIYEMMSHSQKTRELWFSSFFFSWYVRNFYEKLSANHYIEILSPYYDSNNPLPKSKAGLFPDHIVGISSKSADECLKELKEMNTEISSFFINEIYKLGGQLPGKKEQIESIFRDYLQISFVVIPIKDLERKKFVETVDNHLDALERNRSFSIGKNESTCYRCKSLPSVFNITDLYDIKMKEQKVCPFCFLKFKAHHSLEVTSLTAVSEKRPFPSVGEISAGELRRKYPDVFEKLKTGEQEDLNKDDFKQQNSLESDLKDYHKYMAIVIADGDNLGKIANNVDEPQKFSEVLFEFGKSATRITEQFHGEPIYLGGDDLLTFMPTAFFENDSIVTVLDYIRTLSIKYSASLRNIEQTGTISFGVHLFYYKYPLSSSLEEARNLLYEAKCEPGKNSLVLQLTQHSGQQIKIKFSLSSPLLTDFSKLLSGLISGKIQYPEGIHHNLARFKTVLTNLNSPNQLDAFMKNRFNEEIHKKQKGIKIVFDMLKDMLTYKTNGSLNIHKGLPAVNFFNEFLSQIKFIKFLAGDKS